LGAERLFYCRKKYLVRILQKVEELKKYEKEPEKSAVGNASYLKR
jgi:hypothetical protein